MRQRITAGIASRSLSGPPPTKNLNFPTNIVRKPHRPDIGCNASIQIEQCQEGGDTKGRRLGFALGNVNAALDRIPVQAFSVHQLQGHEIQCREIDRGSQ